MESTTIISQRVEPKWQFKKNGCQIYFLRHAESRANCGEKIIDTPLSNRGIEQAKNVEGTFDLVIVSPCRRTLETLHWSKIKCPNVIVEKDIREMIQDETSSLILEQRENFQPETLDSFWSRAHRFTRTLEKHCADIGPGKKVLIISHGFFFNGWYRQGCYQAPENAKLISIF